MNHSPYLGQSLRSPEEIMDARRAKHPELLTQIHALLERAETLSHQIADDHGGCTAVCTSFNDLAKAISELRQDYLKPADHDLREWHKTWEPYNE